VTEELSVKMIVARNPSMIVRENSVVDKLLKIFLIDQRIGVLNGYRFDFCSTF
jgi:hypothetical protein